MGKVSLVHLAIAGGIVLVAVVIVRAMIRGLTSGDDRADEKRLREATQSGDLRRAGDIQAKRGMFREAARLYTQTGEHLRAARALLKVGDAKAAAEAFEKAGDHAAAGEQYRAAGELLKAAEAYQRCDGKAERHAAGECFHAAADYLQAGRAFQEAGEFEKAADAFTRVPKLEPPDLVLTMLENAALGLPTDHPKRERLWARAGEVAYTLGAHERAARAFDESGDPQRAAQIYEHALKRFDVAAALCAELGDSKEADRLTVAAGGRAAVLSVREQRARERGDKQLAARLRAELEAVRAKPDSLAPAPMAARQEPMGAASTVAYGGAVPLELENEAPRPSPAKPAARPTLDASSSRYELRGELGRGGMGIVYKAFDRTLSRPVALKLLPSDLDPDSPLVAVFRREARAAAALSHPGIVTVYDFGTQDGREYIAMELLDGTTLDHVVQDRPMPVMDALDVMEKVLDAVAYAHGRGVVHRDLKPANLMRVRAGGVKVMDFGLAKAFGHATKHTVQGGTPAYMPPEQLRGSADHRSDVFALGATFYELLTSALPGTTTQAASTASGYPSPRERVPAGPARLSDLVMRCLEHDPALRPTDVPSVLSEVRSIRQAIISELRAFVKDERVPEPSVSPERAAGAPQKVGKIVEIVERPAPRPKR
ncbi:MAG: protein kinase [Deltaproteobacteria bacterium]|nr:protein kinase [Deltaproteobacteria bacterium]